jgi:hypothetical protein
VRLIYRRVLDWMVEFIDTLYIHFGTTGNYSGTAVSTHFTVHRYALGFSVFTTRILATDFITVSLSAQITHEVFFSEPNSLLTISAYSFKDEISSK